MLARSSWVTPSTAFALPAAVAADGLEGWSGLGDDDDDDDGGGGGGGESNDDELDHHDDSQAGFHQLRLLPRLTRLGRFG